MYVRVMKKFYYYPHSSICAQVRGLSFRLTPEASLTTSMASSSSQPGIEEKEQLATVQMDALNTVCLHFADADKKGLKRKVTELQNNLRSEYKWNLGIKARVWDESTNHLVEVSTVLEKGTETGLTLSPEEVQRLCKHIEECRAELDALMD